MSRPHTSHSRVAAAALALALTSATAVAQTPWRLEQIGGWGGPVTEIERVGDVAFVATGQRLVSIDLSDPANPVELGGINLGGAIQDIVIVGNYLLTSIASASASPHEFAVLFIGDPAHPEIVWGDNGGFFVEPPNGEIHVYGDLAFYSVGAGLPNAAYAVDISDPAQPQTIGEMMFFPLSTADIVGPYAICAFASIDDLWVFDLADPLAPVIALSMPLIGDAFQVVVEDNIAYVLTDQESRFWLVLLDVTNPTDPQQIGTYLVADNNEPGLIGGGRATDLVVSNGVVYIAVAAEGVNSEFYGVSQGLVVVDATDPGNPMELTEFKTHASIVGVRIDPDDPTRAYLFDHGEGLIILDVSDPANPIRLGNFHSPASMPDMVRDGDLMYVSDRWNGFSILDVADPAEPTLVGVYQTREESIAGGNWGIDHHDGMVYLSTGYAGFEIVDVSDPANPVFAGELAGGWPQGNRAGDLKFNPALGDILHVVLDPGAWLRNFDVDDPGNVTEVGSAFLDGFQPFMRDIELTDDGSTAHVTRGSQVGAVDVTVRDNPQLLSMYSPGGSARADLALHADGQGGIVRYVTEIVGAGSTLFAQDVSDPANPGDPIVFGTSGMAVGVGAGHLFQVRSNGSVRAWSIAPSPLAPTLLTTSVQLLASNTGSNGGVGIHVDDEVLFASDSWDGEKPPTDLETCGLVVLEMVCPNDFNGDGALNILDFVAYQNGFLSQDEHADINGDGTLNILDFVAFQNIFINGCP